MATRWTARRSSISSKTTPWMICGSRAGPCAMPQCGTSRCGPPSSTRLSKSTTSAGRQTRGWTMEIKTTVQQYLARREFYAWEIWHLLQSKSHVSLLDMLRTVSQAGHDVAGEKVTRKSDQNRVLRNLTDYHLLAREKRGRSYYYRLTDLGNAVLGCDRPCEINDTVHEPCEINDTVHEPCEIKPVRKSKYPWETLKPQIRQW